MDMNLMNNTQGSFRFTGPTFIWCLLMPLIHFLSLLSNIICIVVFCSKTFIHKPIAIYFICLLISDSSTLLIGYSEMVDRESNMVEKSSLLCMFNVKIIHKLTDNVYWFMGKYCLEWMLYKILWTRASTILLAILSIQRSRTFYSLSYHETRLCALYSCVVSVLIALFITCFEWMGVQCAKSTDPHVYMDIFQLMMNNKLAKHIYMKMLYDHYNEFIDKYNCIYQSFNITRINSTAANLNQSLCSITRTSSEFYSLTQSLVSSRDSYVSSSTTDLLYRLYDTINITNSSTSLETIHKVNSPEIFIKLFENRSCQITIMFSVYLKLYNFLNSLSFTFNRHTIAIFFGNALPSFIVVLANLSSLKVIYFSTNLKYIKNSQRVNHHRSRLQNDIRAFFVILVESFSIITISWGIPIFLTMFYCHTLYVVSIFQCPNIKQSLALFLFTDLFNSSTNCLLYSLSGKLFRRKFISILRTIFTCGRHQKRSSKTPTLLTQSQQVELQTLNDNLPNFNNINYSRSINSSSERGSSVKIRNLQNSFRNKQLSNNDESLTMINADDERNIDEENLSDFVKRNRNSRKGKSSRTIRRFFHNPMHWFGRRKKNTNAKQRQFKINFIEEKKTRSTV